MTAHLEDDLLRFCYECDVNIWMSYEELVEQTYKSFLSQIENVFSKSSEQTPWRMSNVATRDFPTSKHLLLPTSRTNTVHKMARTPSPYNFIKPKNILSVEFKPFKPQRGVNRNNLIQINVGYGTKDGKEQNYCR